MSSEKSSEKFELILNPTDFPAEIVDLSPGLFRARRAFDVEITGKVREQIGKFEFYNEINEALEQPDLDPFLKDILLKSRAALAAAVAGLIRNKTLKEQCERLKDLASKDKMTGLWNQNAFREYVDNVFEHKENMQMFSFVFADIDHFKKINDTHGHDAGDFILSEVGKIIKQSIRTFDIAARDLNVSERFVNLNKSPNKAFRAGGEEFCFILHGTSQYGASCFADRLRKNIENHEFVYEGVVIPVTMSFGVTESTDDDKFFNSIKVRGDQALYHSKGNGRNKVSIAKFDEESSLCLSIFDK